MFLIPCYYSDVNITGLRRREIVSLPVGCGVPWLNVRGPGSEMDRKHGCENEL